MTYKQLFELAAAANNDQERAVYTDTVSLPYLNIALMELEEIFELNSISITEETSDVIMVPAGTTRIGFNTDPSLPADLVEIQKVWEGDVGQDSFSPVSRRDYLGSTGNTPLSRFGGYKWNGTEIVVPRAIGNLDIKLDYIKSLFTPITIGILNKMVEPKNVSSFLMYRTAGLCAEFIGEDSPRADKLNGSAGGALERSTGISIKGKQQQFFRRRPFRAAYKSRSRI